LCFISCTQGGQVGEGGGEECARGGNGSYLPREMDASHGPSDISSQVALRIELEGGSCNVRVLRMQHRLRHTAYAQPVWPAPQPATSDAPTAAAAAMAEGCSSCYGRGLQQQQQRLLWQRAAAVAATAVAATAAVAAAAMASTAAQQPRRPEQM